jgi:integrase
VLRREWLRQGKPLSGRVVRGPKGGAVAYTKQRARVAKAWAAAELERITPHEGRHTFASYLIASGLNAKAVTVLMGHSSIQITFDRYGHLFPGHEDEAAERLDSYLAAAVSNAVTKSG